jgi:hypothetical protein
MSVHISLAEDRGGITSLRDVSTAFQCFIPSVTDVIRVTFMDRRLQNVIQLYVSSWNKRSRICKQLQSLNVQNISRLLLFSVTCEILTVETVNITISWNTTPCSLIIMLEGTYCFHLQCFSTHPSPFYSQRWSRKFPLNLDRYLPDYLTSYHRRLPSSSLP